MSVDKQTLARIELALEGRLSEAELEALHAEVVRDPVIRAAYADRAWLHGMLRAEADRLPQWLDNAAPGTPAPVRRWAFATWATAAAACVLLGWNLLRIGGIPRVEMVATLVHSENARWAGSTLPTADRAPLGRGTLALVEGLATLRFASGATVTLEAPTKLEILSAMRCRLIEGSVTADVPESAHGFTLDTSDLKVVDLGTRFGVTAGLAGASHVFVFEGEVTLDDGKGAEPRRLLGGKSFHADAQPAVAGMEPAKFQWEQAVDGWTQIATSFGRGRDGYARRGNVQSLGPQPLLMVKHTDLEKGWRNERRAFLTFDLSKVGAGPIQEAELVLDPEPSGLGFSAMVPDSNFSVYGVTEESLDDWSDSELRWENTPACDDAGVNLALVRKVAEFTIARGSAGAPLTVRGDALVSFLRSDTNGLVTFLIVRETGETDTSGLVHAFASKEHPSARPPTLRVR